MTSYQKAVHESRSANLRDDFARELLIRHLGQDAADRIYAALPTYQRGPSKGQPKGQLCWEKVTVGGWSDYGQYGVLRPGTQALRIAKNIYLPGVSLRSVDLRSPECLIDEQEREQAFARILAELPRTPF